MRNIIEFISAIGLLPGDEEDAILQKRFLVYQGALMGIGGLIWGIGACLLDKTWQSLIPFGYTVITVLNMSYFKSTKDFTSTKTIQTTISLLLPFMLQWSVGGFVASGAVMLWALLALVVAVTYQSTRTMWFWLALYILLTIISAAYDSSFQQWVYHADLLPYSTFFFALNIVVISAIFVWLFNFMVHGKSEALHKLRDAQEGLIQSEKMASLGELTAGIAHEIQNPLNFVNNFAEVNKELIDEMGEQIEKGNLDDAKVLAKDIKENDQKIMHHGKRADAIVKGMLQHSRVSSNIKEATDVNALADEYLRLAYHGMRAKAKSFNAQFETDFDPSLPKVNVVPQDIGRVLLNLISNAFYACSEKAKGPSTLPLDVARGKLAQGEPNSETGIVQSSAKSERQKANGDYSPTVTVSTRNLNDKIEIRVKDNGNGIPPNVVDKIFQPFFTTKPTGQGTGLGLSISYDIIKAHGGELTVESAEGQGSEFIIQLPKHIA